MAYDNLSIVKVMGLVRTPTRPKVTLRKTRKSYRLARKLYVTMIYNRGNTGW